MTMITKTPVDQAVPPGVAEVRQFVKFAKDRARRGRGPEGFNFEKMLDPTADRLLEVAHTGDMAALHKEAARAEHVERFRAEMIGRTVEKATEVDPAADLRKEVTASKHFEKKIERKWAKEEKRRLAKGCREAAQRLAKAAFTASLAEAVSEAVVPATTALSARLDAIEEARKGSLISTRTARPPFDPEHVDHPGAADLAAMLSWQRGDVRPDLDQPLVPRQSAPMGSQTGPRRAGGIDVPEEGVTVWET
jgi:hypothetical protein